MVWYCVEKGVIFHEARLSIVLYPCHPAITGGACAKAPQQRERPRGSGCHGEEPLHFNVHTSNLEKCIKSYFNRSSPKMHHIASREAQADFLEKHSHWSLVVAAQFVFVGWKIVELIHIASSFLFSDIGVSLLVASSQFFRGERANCGRSRWSFSHRPKIAQLLSYCNCGRLLGAGPVLSRDKKHFSLPFERYAQ